MAKTETGRRLTAAHLKQQEALRAGVLADVIKLWPIWDPLDPSSYKKFEDAMVVLVRQRSTQSAALAARYVQMFAEAETGGD
jgi:hypothetical protein